MEIINKDIEMIALFDTDGNIRPYRFRYYEDDEPIVVKVGKLIHRTIPRKQPITIFKY